MGLLAFRELDEAFRLTEQGSIVLADPRHGKNTQHTMLAMLRQSVYGRLAGYSHRRSFAKRTLPILRQRIRRVVQEVRVYGDGDSLLIATCRLCHRIFLEQYGLIIERPLVIGFKDQLIRS